VIGIGRTSASTLNRSQNPKAIGLPKCLTICEQEPIGLNQTVKENMYLRMEIRDTAIHFQHADLYFSKRAFEIGTASLQNYYTLIAEWFNYDLSIYNSFLMPMTSFTSLKPLKVFGKSQ